MSLSYGASMAKTSLDNMVSSEVMSKTECRNRMAQIANFLNQFLSEGGDEAQSLRIDLQTYQSFLIRKLEEPNLPETYTAPVKVITKPVDYALLAEIELRNAQESAARANDLVSKQQAAAVAQNALIAAQKAQAAAAEQLSANNSTANQNAVNQAAAALHTATSTVSATSQAVLEAQQIGGTTLKTVSSGSPSNSKILIYAGIAVVLILVLRK